jgi:2'-5' RNA ligase
VLWLGVGPAIPAPLVALQGGLEAAARRCGFAAEEREFRPHLTLARAAGPRPAPPGATDAARWSEPVREVVLFESRLHPSGARYTALETFPLGQRT